MYSADNDDKLPDGDLNVQLREYLEENVDILKKFTPTFQKGIEQSKINAPSDYELGFVRGPGGRAIVYSDGSAKWVPDRK